VKVPVVTAITGGRDRLKQQPSLADAEYFAFLDREHRCTGWNAVTAYAGFDSPVLNAKHHKVLVHRWFPSAEFSLWIDGRVVVTLTGGLQELVEEHLRKTDLAVFAHRTRSCIYEEALACIALGTDDPAVIERQVGGYQREGYPEGNGLAELSVILRRHTARANSFAEAWWNEIVTGSCRDQLSFDYVAWRRGLKYSVFPGTLAQNALFHRGGHDGEAEAARRSGPETGSGGSRPTSAG
jgi:hypothetical protein